LLLFRMLGHLTMQEAQGADTLGMLHALGAAGQADGRSRQLLTHFLAAFPYV
jgi:hypothetical protein